MNVSSNIECLRSGYENQLFGQIESRLGCTPELDYDEAEHLFNVRKQRLLAAAFYVNEDLLPEVYGVYRSCLKMLGLDLQGGLFVQQCKDYNANIFSHEGKFDLLLNSGVIKDFATDELKFIIGHEMGHIIFKHSRFPVREILALIDSNRPDLISPETKAMIFSWSRAAELSADRIGLFCCGQLASAVKALFQTSSGLFRINVDQILRSFRNQYDRLEEHISEGSFARNMLDTHPMIPIRFKALELAALDIIALHQIPKQFSRKGFRATDLKISSMLKAVDKSLGSLVTPCF